MNAWLIGALVLLVTGLGPCLVVSTRGSALDRLVGLDLAGVVSCLVFLLLAQGLQRSSYVDLALVLAPLSLAGCLVFTRLLRRPT
ncbi:MAG: monovalent cation/H+ antiporter complex subunit F [Mycobacteriales bacterium]